jgi:hypothetical protein
MGQAAIALCRAWSRAAVPARLQAVTQETGDGCIFQQLKAEILKLSRATDCEVAKKERKLVDLSEVEEPEARICGQLSNHQTLHRSQFHDGQIHRCRESTGRNQQLGV